MRRYLLPGAGRQDGIRKSPCGQDSHRLSVTGETNARWDMGRDGARMEPQEQGRANEQGEQATCARFLGYPAHVGIQISLISAPRKLLAWKLRSLKWTSPKAHK